MEKRYSHLWREAKGDSYPTQVIVMDVETTSEVVSRKPLIERDTLSLWYAMAGRLKAGEVTSEYSANGKDAPSFWKRLSKWLCTGTVTWLFLPQAGRVLTTLDFWDLLESNQFRLSGDDGRYDGEQSEGKQRKPSPLCVLEDPPTIISCRMADRAGQLRIIDLRNYGISSIGNIRPIVNKVKTSWQFVLDMIGILKRHGMGSLRETAGSQGCYSIRRKYLQHTIHCHTYESALRLERNAYHGGRNECYHIGELFGPHYLLDVKSMYLSVSANARLPTVLIDHIEHPTMDELYQAGKDDCVIADVTIETDKPDYPAFAEFPDSGLALPYKYWERGAWENPRPFTAYPIGRFRTCLPGPELMDAILQKRVKAVHEMAVYDGHKALSGFCNNWYGLLSQATVDGNKPVQEWIKTVIVATIGKFGSGHFRWVDADDVPATQPFCQWMATDSDGVLRRYRSIGWHVQKEEYARDGMESVPSVACWITSLARYRLLQLMREAGRQNVFYCDTDSLIVNQAGYNVLSVVGEIRENVLGYLKEEAASLENEIFGLKHYRIGAKRVFAGLPRGTAIPASQQGTVWHFQSPADQIKQGLKPLARRRLIPFTFSPTYNHGIVQDDGSIKPLEWRDHVD